MKQVRLINRTYYFHHFVNDEPGALTSGVISFCDENGIFSALGHGPEHPMDMAVVYEEYHAETGKVSGDVGAVLHADERGIYGAYYDGLQPPTRGVYPVLPFLEIREGPATMLFPVGSDRREAPGEIVALFPGKPYPVLFLLGKGQRSVTGGVSGCVILQDGKLAAVVAGGETDPGKLLYCTAAEDMLLDQ